MNKKELQERLDKAINNILENELAYEDHVTKGYNEAGMKMLKEELLKLSNK